MHLYLLKLLEISEIVRVKKITNGLKKSLLKIIKKQHVHMIWKQDIWIAPGRQNYYDMSSLLYDCNYWATNFITGLLFELRGLKGSIGI